VLLRNGVCDCFILLYFTKMNGYTTDCAICYDPLDISRNNCNTICGHSFCMNCFISAIQRNNSCPLCRSELYKKANKRVSPPEPENDIADDESETSSESSEDSYTIYYDNVSVENISIHMKERGFSYLDLIMWIFPNHHSLNPKFGQEYRSHKLVELDHMFENDETNEMIENTWMGREDQDAYGRIRSRSVENV
jgi:hypothetical protein